MSTIFPKPFYKYHPNLSSRPHRQTSDPTEDYNCIAYAVGDKQQPWWPYPGYKWPAECTYDDTVDSFIEMFKTLGYEKCDDGSTEKNTDKVAIYAIGNEAKHAAIQCARWGGKWRSKCGDFADIEHDLSALEDDTYGRVVAFLRRAIRA
jgi:hypothetical protein